MPVSDPVLHRAARAEDALNRAAATLMRRRGWRPRLIPYTGYGTNGWVRVLARVLLSPPVVAEHGPVATRGWRHFISAKIGGVPVTITIGDQQHVVECGRGGYVDVVLPATLEPGWNVATLTTADAPPAQADIRVVGPDERLGIISDIDDTVLITALPRPLLAFWNTFVRRGESRKPVPGMPEFYRTIRAAQPDAFVVYVSTGAWNVAPALQRFMDRLDFPKGPLLLTDWGPTPDGWFRSGQEHKRSTLRRLVDEFPQLLWVLVGDDGQHDPALYDELVWARPDGVRMVAIRQLAAAEQVLTHGTPVPLPAARDAHLRRAGAKVPWVRAPNGHELVVELRRLGLLDDDTLRPQAVTSSSG
jgi:phosphatidate phosphatase APP1